MKFLVLILLFCSQYTFAASTECVKSHIEELLPATYQDYTFSATPTLSKWNLTDLDWLQGVKWMSFEMKNAHGDRIVGLIEIMDHETTQGEKGHITMADHCGTAISTTYDAPYFLLYDEWGDEIYRKASRYVAPEGS